MLPMERIQEQLQDRILNPQRTNPRFHEHTHDLFSEVRRVESIAAHPKKTK
jgi:hypothetical protein